MRFSSGFYPGSAGRKISGYFGGSISARNIRSTNKKTSKGDSTNLQQRWRKDTRGNRRADKVLNTAAELVSQGKLKEVRAVLKSSHLQLVYSGQIKRTLKGSAHIILTSIGLIS